jgi:splicing factor U2AF subunit
MQLAATKSQREIYVGNIPPAITIPQLTQFVNDAMTQLGIAQPSAFGGPVLTCWISTDAHYAVIGLRTVEEAMAALNGLNGVSCAGYQLRVGRPKTHGAAGGGGGGQMGMVGNMGMMGQQPLGLGQLAPLGGYGVGTLPMTQPLAPPPAPEVSNVLMVANLPDTIGESQVREILEPFGEIKLFNFIKVPMNGGSGGAAVLEYVDPTVGESAIAGLNGLPVGDKQLSVQKVPMNMAALLLKPARPPAPPAPVAGNAIGGLPSIATTSTDSDPLLSAPPAAVLRMSNMTTLEELRDDEIYEELQEDIADECNQHGTVRSIIIPRPALGADSGPGVGEVFVCFTHSEGAEKAKNAVHGRTFNGLSVKAVFYPEDLFHAKVYSLPEGYVVGAAAAAEAAAEEEENMD